MVHIPKGKTITSKGIRPSFLTKKQAESFQTLKRRYNDRIRKAETRAAERYGVTRMQVRQTGVYGIPVGKRLTDIRNKREYDYLMKMMRGSSTKKYRAQVSHELRDTLFDVLRYAYMPGPEGENFLRSVVFKMTDAEIMEFRFSNPYLVKDFFELYKANLYEGGADLGDMKEGWEKLRTALEPYRKGRR